MSSDQTVKKRRLEGSETPKAASAVSAIAALRRSAASSIRSTPSTPEAEDKSVKSNVNYFSPLQKNDDQNGSPKPSQKGGPKPRRPRKVDSPVVPSREASLLSEAGNSELVIAPGPSRGVQYSSFRLSKSNHRQKAGGIIELRLHDNERFLVLGSFGIHVLQGEVTIAGATLRPSEHIHWAHAPHCYAVPVLRSAESSRLELHPDPNSLGLRQLGKLSPLFRRMWNEPAEPGTKKRNDKNDTFRILCSSEDAPKKCIIQSLVSPAQWNRKLATLVAGARKLLGSKFVVCGPKSAGKSTFSKLLANRLITERYPTDTLAGVAVLDLDPGQPEYTPAGLVSLVHLRGPNLGTPFTHPGAPETAWSILRSHALASVTPASDPEVYLECAADLFETYKRSLAPLPLIVNTPGWILGTGLDLLSEIIKVVEPSEVLYMSEDGPMDTVESLRACAVSRLTELPSQQSEFTSRTAAHLRAMQYLSYFHVDEVKSVSIEQEQTIPRLRWNPAPLSTKPPLLVRYASPSPGILGVISYDYQSPPELLAETINGMILALVEIEDNRAFRGLAGDGLHSNSEGDADLVERQASIPKILTTPEGLPFIPNFDGLTLDPRYSRTVGLVLARGIDPRAKAIQVLTPIQPEHLHEVRRRGHSIVLVHGKFDAPNWAYMEDLYERADNEEGHDDKLEVTDEDTGDDDSEAEPEDVERVDDIAAVPWVEVLKGNEKRPVGSRVWRVRRDLGRQGDG